MEKVP